MYHLTPVKTMKSLNRILSLWVCLFWFAGEGFVAVTSILSLVILGLSISRIILSVRVGILIDYFLILSLSPFILSVRVDLLTF